jgi:hypothetical protein
MLFHRLVALLRLSQPVPRIDEEMQLSSLLPGLQPVVLTSFLLRLARRRTTQQYERRRSSQE